MSIHESTADQIRPVATRTNKRALARIVREINPYYWPLGGLLLVGELARRMRPTLRNTYSHSRVTVPTSESLNTLMDWIAFAQDRTPSGGLPAYFSLYGGFGPTYPEITGYWIPTLIEYGTRFGKEEFLRRAIRAADWLCGLQMANGSFPGGYARKDDGPSVFNTGQIIFGLLAAGRLSGGENYLRAAYAAGQWLASVQSEDGAWRTHTYEGAPHVYYTMVAWALADLFKQTGEEWARNAALKQVKWVLTHQKPNGWIEGHNLGARPTFLHFIAYTLEGLVEVGAALEMPEAVESARIAAEVLMRQFEIRKRLAGAYAPDWKPDGAFVCLTGNAQTSMVWGRLAKLLGDLRYLNATLKMNELLKSTIKHRGSRLVRGAVKGSEPIWGSYLPLRYPSWAAKFTADSFLLELGALEELEKSLNLCES
jgi:Prenyltransferase and squalene oxidase repeat